ncbi:MAG: hypothetical protein BMS9Abin11_0865 [Gammaproteobacteria bacterium]|nr:MAG: hypothetical protein BMS9Abin11_0865 [Gammaproteobacteria bacterium]
MLAIDVSLLVLMLSQSRAGASYPTIESTYPEHTLAVKKARSGDHQGGLLILQRLLQHFPKDYPLQRDYAIVTAWSDDCKLALKRFKKIQNSSKHKPYIITLMGECMVRQGRYKDALSFLDKSQKKYPNHSELRHLRQKALIEEASRTSSGTEIKNYTQYNESDQGFPEWLVLTEASFQVSKRNRFFSQYIISRSSDDAFKAGEQDRLAIGWRYQYSPHLFLEQSVSKDVKENGLGGSLSRIRYNPSDTWNFEFMHDTYSLDIPIRAKASNVEAKQTTFSMTYDVDESWYGYVTVNRYRFSDTNIRESLYGEYGILLLKKTDLEHRLSVEVYSSRNSLTGAPYFNPIKDKSLSLTYKLDLHFRSSRFDKHSDQFSISLGQYDQEGFETRGRWGLYYGQDYKISNRFHFSYGLGYGRNVYDGQLESEKKFEMKFLLRL